ncbi:sensor domain-containing protein [Neobacillus sp. LXY-1]|uniref:sensor domain-containing protein n=1 Tax=Neobacillus sp. LXY-1 TaxID=3379133 RepID=UPI003EE33182
MKNNRLLLLFLIPPILSLLGKPDHYIHHALWALYLIPPTLIVLLKGVNYSILSICTSSLLFLTVEIIKTGKVDLHTFISFLELIIVNIVFNIFVSTISKQNSQKRQELIQTRKLLDSILNNVDISIWSLTPNKDHLFSRGKEKIYGSLTAEQLNEEGLWRKSIHPDDLPLADEIDSKWEVLEDYEYEYRIVQPNGTVRWIRDRAFPVIDEDGALVRYDGTNIDITAQKELEFHLKESEERYKNLVENASLGVFMVQHQRIIFMNKWLMNMLDLTEEKLHERTFFEHFLAKDKDRLIEKFLRLYTQKEAFFKDQIQLTFPNKRACFLEIQASTTVINGKKAVLGIALDVTEKLKSQAKLEYLAYHDALTTTPNMHYLNNKIREEICLAKKHGSPASMMFFNLDRFKLIVDSYGHQVGDHLLKKVALRLKGLVSEKGTLIRVGGDDFIVYLPNFELTRAEQFAKFLIQSFSEPFFHKDHEVRISASIGISFLKTDSVLEKMVQEASAAMHVAKEIGGNQYKVYSADFKEKSDRKLQIDQKLRKAIEQDNLELYYQPKIELSHHQLTGMEALIRWNDPELGFVSPSEFIPIAEETGLIIPIGKWVLETACKHNIEWQKKGYAPIQVCVNISSKQFLQDDFINMVEECLQDSGLSPEYLNLEITEGIALYNIKEAIVKLNKLKQLGLSVSLDDFGTGYSSLSYIKSLPIDVLKIDRSFIIDICENKQDAAIIQSVISLSHSLDLIVVAEGVENEQQLSLLGNLNCDEIQGYYYAKPMSYSDFENFLTNVHQRKIS